MLLENAEDALVGWLLMLTQFIKEPSKYHELECLKRELVPVLVNEQVVASYQKLKRFNVIFPVETLRRIDAFRKKAGLKRSTFLQKAVEKYLQEYEQEA